MFMYRQNFLSQKRFWLVLGIAGFLLMSDFSANAFISCRRDRKKDDDPSDDTQELPDDFDYGGEDADDSDVPAGPVEGTAGTAPTGWSGPVGATVNLDLHMPTWTEGWLQAGAAWGNVPKIRSRARLTGRDIEAASRHVVLMRTEAGDTGPRTWSSAALAHSSRPWYDKVYSDTWPSVSDLTGFGQGGVGESASGEAQEYERFNRYVTWSE